MSCDPNEYVMPGMLLHLRYGVIAVVVWLRGVLGMSPQPKQVGAFLFFHLVSSAVLGANVL